MAELKKKQIVMFGGYFDESGISDNSQVTVIAGFLGGPPAMHRIGKEWNKVLRRYGVNVPFHAIEFYAPAEKIRLSTSNPYRGWSATKRKNYIKDLLRVLRKYSAHLIANVVDSVAFRSRSEDERKWMTGGISNVMNPNKWYLGKPNSPYHFALRVVVECCAVRIPDGDKVHIFMSEQNQYEGYALELYKAIRETDPPIEGVERLDDSMTFGSHKQYPVLQAADLVCYHFYQFGLERRVNPEFAGSKTFRQLLALVENPSDMKSGDAESIERICARFATKRASAAASAHLRRTRLRVKVSHDPKDCQVLGTVDEFGTFHPKQAQDISQDRASQNECPQAERGT
jgi:hypothetical protein